MNGGEATGHRDRSLSSASSSAAAEVCSPEHASVKFHFFLDRCPEKDSRDLRFQCLWIEAKKEERERGPVLDEGDAHALQP